MCKAKVSWVLCIGRLVSKTDNVMHFAHLVKQASADWVEWPICPLKLTRTLIIDWIPDFFTCVVQNCAKIYVCNFKINFNKKYLPPSDSLGFVFPHVSYWSSGISTNSAAVPGPHSPLTSVWIENKNSFLFIREWTSCFPIQNPFLSERTSQS